MYCRTCDIEYPNSLRFCKYCGEGLVARESIGTQYCPACGSAIEREWAFCNECGVDLATLGAQPRDEICPSCSASVKRGWMFCRQCGEQVASDRAASRCPNCNAGIRDGWIFCKQCGVGLAAHADDQTAFRTVAGIPALPPEADEAEPFSNLKSGELPPLDDVISASRQRRSEKGAHAEDGYQGTKPLTVSRSTGHLDTDALEQEFRNHSESDLAPAVAREGRLEASEFFDTSSEDPTSHLSGGGQAPDAGMRTEVYSAIAPPASVVHEHGATSQVDSIPPVGAHLADGVVGHGGDATVVVSAPPVPPSGGPDQGQTVVVSADEMARAVHEATPDWQDATPIFEPPPAGPVGYPGGPADSETQVYAVPDVVTHPEYAEPAPFDPYATHVGTPGSFGIQLPPPVAYPPGVSDDVVTYGQTPPEIPGSPTVALPSGAGITDYGQQAYGGSAATQWESPRDTAVRSDVPDVRGEFPRVGAPTVVSAPSPFPSARQDTGAEKGRGTGVRMLVLAAASLLVLVVLGIGGFFGIRWYLNRAQPVAGQPPVVAEPPTTPVAPPTAPATPQPPPGMVYVPGGTFELGTNDPATDQFSRPAHSVTVKPFFIDATEVTNAQYKAFVDATGYKPPRKGWDGTSPRPGTEQMPVVFVSWEDARKYAEWAKKRLPTEQEWEFAARGSDGRAYPWGPDWDVSKGNIGKGSGGSIVAVGSYPAGASPFGAQDMVGNVWEWTASPFGAYPGGQVDAEEAAAFKDSRVIRGGAYDNMGDKTAMYRGFQPPSEDTLPRVGFRCAQDVPAP